MGISISRYVEWWKFKHSLSSTWKEWYETYIYSVWRCAQSVYSLYLGVESYSYYYNYHYDLPLVMSNVTCVGDESRLIDCYYDDENADEYTFPVTLECTAQGKSLFFNFNTFSLWSVSVFLNTIGPGSCNYGDIKLTGGVTENEGRVELCNSRSLWGTVCNNQWPEANSRVVCSSLGFSEQEGTITNRHYNTYRLRIWQEVWCSQNLK